MGIVKKEKQAQVALVFSQVDRSQKPEQAQTFARPSRASAPVHPHRKILSTRTISVRPTMISSKILGGLRSPGFIRPCGLWRRQFAVCHQLQQQHTPEQDRPAVPENVKQSSKFAPELAKTPFPQWELERLRVVPALNTFYGGNPIHDDIMNKLKALVTKYEHLPTKVVDAKEANTHKFMSFEEYKVLANSGTRLKVGHHKALLAALHRLRSIDTQLMPSEVADVLQQYASAAEETRKSGKTAVLALDEFGRANAVGKRKRSVAHVSMVRGDGQVLVNGQSFLKVFARDNDRNKIAYPFKVVCQEGQYNIFITTEGGGVSGQAEAAMYGIAKALVIFNPLFKPRLRQAGLMTRDTRKVERKKPGKLKARKSPTWVKR